MSATAGYEQDVFRMLRIMFRTAIRPQFDASGLIVDPAASGAQYWPLASATAVLFDGSDALQRACDRAHTHQELCHEFDQLTTRSALMGAQVQLVVLAFSRGVSPIAVQEVQAVQAQRNQPRAPPTAMRSALMRTDSRRDALLRALMAHLLEECPLRKGLTLVVSGLTHVWWPDRALHMPLAVRLSPCGRQREVVPPWDVLPGVPRDLPASAWFRSAHSAVDHLKFWAMALRTRPQSALCVVQCEEPRLLVELLALIETHDRLHPVPATTPVSRLVLVHQIVAGYRPKAGTTAVPPELDRHQPVHVLEQVDVGSLSTLLTFALQDAAERSGMNCGPAVALLFALWLRPHHYNDQPFVRHLARASPCSAYQLWMDLLQHGATLSEPARGRVLELDSAAPGLYEPLVASVNYTPMAQLLLALSKAAGAPASPPDTWTGEGQMRAHAARLALWLSMALNCAPAYCAPDAGEHSVSPDGTRLPTYGYARRTEDRDDDTRLAVVDKLPAADSRQRYEA